MTRCRMSGGLEDWGGEELLVHRDGSTGSWSFIAMHSTERGPAVGGTRMRTYESVEAALADALRLSQGMTDKTATAGLPCGGAKAVIAVPADLSDADRSRLLLEHAARVEALAGRFVTGPDMGTGEADMDLMGTVTKHVFCRSLAAGGSGTASPWTAMGVFHGVKASLRYQRGSDDLADVRVVIQGVGEVGERLARLLHADGAALLISDVDQARVTQVAAALPGTEIVAPDDVSATACDVYSPCAMGATLNERTIPRLRCSIVAGAANNQLETAADADRLRSRGILYAPDYVINAGGIIRAVGTDTVGWSDDEIDGHVAAIGDTLTEIFRSRDGISVAA